MITNSSYTIRFISTEDPTNFITSIEIKDPDLCSVSHDGYKITIFSHDILGETEIVIKDFTGNTVSIPIIIDNIIYSYQIKYNNEIVDADHPALLYFKDNDTNIKTFQIIEKKFSTLYNKDITTDEKYVSDKFSVSFQYPEANNDIKLSLSNNNFNINVQLLSPYSETNVLVNIISYDNTVHNLSLPIYVIDNRKLNVFPSNDTIILSEKNTTSTRLSVFGTNNPISVEVSDQEGFNYTVSDNNIDLLPIGSNSHGSTLKISVEENGNLKQAYKVIYVKEFKLETYKLLKFIRINEPFEFPVLNVVGELSVVGVGETLNNFTHTIKYDKKNYSATVTITPTDTTLENSQIKFIDTVEGREPRVVTVNVKFIQNLELIVEQNNVMALDIPLKIRFKHANGPLKFLAVSKITGNNIKATYEYDINQYNQKVDYSSGYFYVYPIIEDKIILKVIDSVNYAEVELTSLKNPNDFSKWDLAVTNKIENLSNNLTAPIVFSNNRLKTGDFVGTNWIKGFKYGIHQVTKIFYRVTPPNSILNNQAASLNWLKNLKGTTHNLTISIRDGFTLDDKNKNYTVKATCLKDNIFETDDLTDQNIIFKDAETILITDDTDRISITNSKDKHGVIIYNEDGNEVITSRIDFEPVSYIEIKSLSPIKKIPINKPMNCYDIKRLDPTVVDGEFKIYPSLNTDKNVNVFCKFKTDENGNDDTETIIPEKSIRKFMDIVGSIQGANGIELDLVSHGGIHPEFYPSPLNSYNQLSYLFIELPYAIKSFQYKLETIEQDENATGTFKILSDTSDIFHINGTKYANSMITRQGSILEYNADAVKENLGQVVILPQGSESYEHIENAYNGSINLNEPSDRIIIMNSGSAEPYTLAETFLKELSFNSVFDPNNLSSEYWLDSSDSGIDLKNLVTLRSEINWVISDIISIPYTFEKVLSLTPSKLVYNISNVKNQVIELDEFVNVLPHKNIYIVSDKDDPIIDLSEFVKVKPDKNNYIISNKNSIENNIEIKHKLYTDISNIISDLDLKLIELKAKIDENIKCGYHEYNISLKESLIAKQANLPIFKEKLSIIDHAYNISLIDTNVNEMLLNSVKLSVINEEIDIIPHEYNISLLTSFIDVNEYVNFQVVHPNIISVVINDKTVSEIPTSLNLTAVTTPIISLENSYIINIPENINFKTNIHNIISNIKYSPIEIQPKSKLGVYHPVIILMRTSDPVDISNNSINSYLSSDTTKIISLKTHSIMDINLENNLLTLGHKPKFPFTIYQDARKANVYSDHTPIDIRNIEYTGTETDVINRVDTESLPIDIRNIEYSVIETDIINQVDTESLPIDIRNIEYNVIETDIINQVDTESLPIDIRNIEYIVIENDIINHVNTDELIPIDMVNIEYTGTETDIINCVNTDELIPIDMVNIEYTGTETDIINCVNTDELIPIDMVNIEYNGVIPHTNIISQHHIKTYSIGETLKSGISSSRRPFILSQKNYPVLNLGETENLARDNTYVCTQKSLQVTNMDNLLRIHKRFVNSDDIMVEAKLNEFESSDSDTTMITNSKNKIRETTILDFEIEGSTKEININTFNKSNVKSIETISVV